MIGNNAQSVYFGSNFQHSTDPSCQIGSRRALSEAEGQPFAGLLTSTTLSMYFDYAQYVLRLRSVCTSTTLSM
jgi:hypothetical protein